MFLQWGGQGYVEGRAAGDLPKIEEWDRSVYALISSQGLFSDGPEGAWNPIAAEYGYLEEEPIELVDPVAEEARQYTLDQLTDLARQIKDGNT